MKRRGNCYVTCEALYHLLGGKKAGWRAFTIYHEGDIHWYLEQWKIAEKDFTYRYSDENWFARAIRYKKGDYVEMITRVDPTTKQFKNPPDYSKGVGRGFLTKKPSKRARALMKVMLWQSR